MQTDLLESTTVIENEEENSAVDFDLEQMIEVKDSEADSNVPMRPPEKGVYPFKWQLNTEKGGGETRDGFVIPKGIELKADKNKSPFVGVHLIGTLSDESSDYNGYQINAYINSIVFKGKSTSELHSFLAKLGRPVSNKTSLKSLILHVENVMSESPIGQAELDWKFSYQGDDKNKKWVDQHKRMEDFPKDSDGNYSNVVESEKDGEPGYASGYIRRHVASN